jgi:hypothetical protein
MTGWVNWIHHDTSCEVNLLTCYAGYQGISHVMIDGLLTFKPSNSGEITVGVFGRFLKSLLFK